MHEPLVSIIIPTFNRPDILPDTINNVLAQTWQNTQIIIIDDGTSEKSMEVVKSYNDDRIIYKKTKENFNIYPFGIYLKRKRQKERNQLAFFSAKRAPVTRLQIKS